MKIILFFACFAGLLFFVSCSDPEKAEKPGQDNSHDIKDLPRILESGVIRVVTNYNSTSYFIYRGTPMGYQFELLQEFANHIGIKLELTVNNNLQENFNDLKAGRVDIIAGSLAVTKDSETFVAFTEPHSYTRQVLVQRSFPRGGERVDLNMRESALIRNQLDLAGRTVYVQKGSAYVQRLRNLSNEIGDTIHVVEIPNYDVEQLIELVAKGEIPLTVCNENLARVNLNFFPNIDIETPISFLQQQAWAVNKNAPELLKAINKWMVTFKNTNRYQRIYNRYFHNSRSAHLVNTKFHSTKGGRISVFDDLIREESKRHEMDWRLIASIIYQESRFMPDAESWAGAMGLMQLMPATAERFGVADVFSPRDNIRGGLELLTWLDEQFLTKIADPDERIKFVLASYNVGFGHVLDAIRLAEKHGRNPLVWTGNVDYFILNKSRPIYYNDPVVKFGFCRGEEPYYYVKEVLERFAHYKNVIR